MKPTGKASPSFRLYDQSSIDSLPWPKTEQGMFAKSYLKPLIQDGPHIYFSNISTTLLALFMDDFVLPITCNNKIEDNAYMCSTYTQYVLYALEEVNRLNKPLARSALRKLIYGLAALLKWGEIDKTVFVNNWLMPTNLYPTLSQNQVEKLSEGLIEQFPDHAIAFRSVNQVTCPQLFQHLKDLGYDLVMSRNIYYTDTKNDLSPLKARMAKSDFKLLETTSYKLLKNEEIEIEASCRIAELYRMLNIDKHNAWNPCYTDRWIKLIRKIPGFSLFAFQKKNNLEGALAYYELNGAMTSPLFGYNTEVSQEMGLYRQISALLLKEAFEKKKMLHQSSGAGHFKMLRRAKKDFEYTAVYCKHLSWRRQTPWKILSHAMNSVGKGYLSKE